MFSTLLFYKFLFFVSINNKSINKDWQKQLKFLDLNFVKVSRSVVELITKRYYNDDYGSGKLYTKK